jgi:hypothetical protein
MRQSTGRDVAIELRLAQSQCISAEPGSAAAAWADTSPGEDPEPYPLKSAAEIPAFQGTIAE